MNFKLVPEKIWESLVKIYFVFFQSLPISCCLEIQTGKTIQDKSTFQNVAFQIQWKCIPMLQKQVHIHENCIFSKHRLFLGGLVIHMAPYTYVQNNGISQNSNSQRKMHIHPLWYHLKTALMSSVWMFIPIYPEFLTPHQFIYLNFKEGQIHTGTAQAGGQHLRNMKKNGINASPQSAT